MCVLVSNPFINLKVFFKVLYRFNNSINLESSSVETVVLELTLRLKFLELDMSR